MTKHKWNTWKYAIVRAWECIIIELSLNGAHYIDYIEKEGGKPHIGLQYSSTFIINKIMLMTEMSSKNINVSPAPSA